MPDIDIDKLQIEVSASSEDATKKIRKLASSMRSLKKALAETNGVNSLANSLKSLGSAIKDAGATVEMANAIKSIGKQEAKIGNVADYLLGISKMDFSNLTSASNVIGELAEIAASVKATKIAAVGGKSNTTPQVSVDSGEEESPKKFGISWKNVFNDIKIASGGSLKNFFNSARNTNEEASRLAYALDSVRVGFVNIAKSSALATWNVSKFGASILLFPLKGFTNSIKNAITSVRKFTSSIGRILMYRAIRTLLKEVTQSIKDGIDNLSAYSRLIDTEFHKSLDGIASDALYIKNSLASVAAPIINFVKPAFDALADSIANALNILAEFMARMTGAASYSKAIKFNTEYGDSIQKAGEKAKKAKANLLGIDELNIFQEPTSGTGGGFSADDYSKMFEEVKLDTDKVGLAEQIREAIKRDDWRGAGETLAQKLNESIASINAFDFGKTIGEKINNALESAYGFLKTFDSKKLGGEIASFVNGALEEINFETAGRIFARKFTAFFDLVIGFVETLDWKLVGKSIGDYLRGAFDEASEWVESYNWKDMAENLWGRFKLFIEGVDVKSLSKSFFNFISNAITALADFISGIDWGDVVDTMFDVLSDFIVNADVKKLVKSLAYLVVAVVAQIPVILTEAIAGITEKIGDIFESLGFDSIGGFFKGISEEMKNVGKKLKEEVIEPFVGFVKNLLGIHSPSAVFAEIGKQVDEGFLKGLKDSWGNVTSWLSAALSNLKQSAKNVFQNIKDAASTAWSNLKTNVSVSAPAFATGGFPEDGLFYANHGELVGQFSNGRTAVANNEQIVDGIRAGVSDANEDLISTVATGLSQIISLLENRGGGISMDDFANSLYPQMQAIDSRRGLVL